MGCYSEPLEIEGDAWKAAALAILPPGAPSQLSSEKINDPSLGGALFFLSGECELPPPRLGCMSHVW